MPKNGQPRPQSQTPPPIFQMIRVFTEDGMDSYEYAQHTFQFNPTGGGVLIVQETRGEKETSIYPMDAFRRVVLTPTKLSLA